MRYDDVGFFWEDLPEKNKRGEVVRPMPEIPDTGWRTPTEFPNLSAAKALAIDVETKDPDLKERGPGWGRGSGHLVGLAVAVVDGPSWYFPFRHEVEPDYNLDPAAVLGWAAHYLSGQQPKIGTNLIYDVGWLEEEGVKVGGPMYDIQYAEALLNSEAPNVALENLAQEHLGIGKTSSLLYEWCSQFYGGPATAAGQGKNIHRAPPRLVGPYAQSDVELPIQILQRQWRRLADRGVMNIFNMECGLIRLLVAMRRKGCPVDIPAAEKMHARLGEEMEYLARAMKDLVGFEVNPNASASIGSAFEVCGLPITETTSKGAPSFTASVLEAIDHPLTSMILEYKQKAKLRSTFIESYILNSHVNGRVHCQFHPLKGDGYGARSGRFASANPNLQNIPVRSEEGRLIRNLFVATKRRWRKFDYSQIEYRLLAHHAVGPGSVELRERYNTNPQTDYHEATGELIKALVGIELERRPIKTINFGLIYGMGRLELIRRLALGSKAGKELFDSYHKAVPFAKATADAAADEAQITGIISTFMGRISDFNSWGPAGLYGEDIKPLSFEEALTTYGRIQRAFTHKALNRKLQGGAADIMKTAMVTCYEAGIFDETGIPLLTVHDELDFDDDTDDDSEAFKEMKHIMETCVKLSVPIVADEKSGSRWSECD